MTEADRVGPERTLKSLARILADLGIVSWAVTGSVALGYWATPRASRDVDVCGTLPVEAVDKLLARHDGMRFGPSELPDMVRFTVGDWDVDFFVARTEYDHVCLSRAREVAVDDTVIRVVTPEDFLIHKLIKLRTDRRRILQDIADLRTMLSAQRTSLDFAYLDEWLPQADRDLLESIAGLDDEAVVRRILGA